VQKRTKYNIKMKIGSCHAHSMIKMTVRSQLTPNRDYRCMKFITFHGNEIFALLKTKNN